jgi:hypothetical protein
MQHSSIAQASLCTATATRAYFVNGTLPQPGTECRVDVSLFAGTDGWDEVMGHFAEPGSGGPAARGVARGRPPATRLVGMGPLKPFSMPVLS